MTTMKKLIPLVMLGLLAAGGYWSAQTFLRPLLATETGQSLPLVIEGECRLAGEGCVLVAAALRLHLMTVGTISPLRRFAFVLDGPQDVASATVSLEMIGMDMGVNRVRLDAVDEGRREGSTILPACPAGRSDWVARLNVTIAGRRYEGAVPFVVERH